MPNLNLMQNKLRELFSGHATLYMIQNKQKIHLSGFVTFGVGMVHPSCSAHLSLLCSLILQLCILALQGVSRSKRWRDCKTRALLFLKNLLGPDNGLLPLVHQNRAENRKVSDNRKFQKHPRAAERKPNFQAPIKLAQPFPAPESWTKHFTDTKRIFLILFGASKHFFL